MLRESEHSDVKCSQLPRIFKPITVHQLTHSNCLPDRAMKNEDIENVNDRELFSELFDNPIHPLLIHIVPPFIDKKDPMVGSNTELLPRTRRTLEAEGLCLFTSFTTQSSSRARAKKIDMEFYLR